MTTKLYQKIDECVQDTKNVVLTVLDGKHLGEKALVSDGKIIWESKKEFSFIEHLKEIMEIKESGVTRFGERQVFVDILAHEKHMVICGGGHVSIPIIQIGLMIGYEVTVLEDRPKFADNARKAGASNVICEPFEAGLDRIEGNGDTYFVIVTRGHRYDQACLEMIAKKKHAYIGMIGSRRRVALVKRLLIEKGVDKVVLNAVHTPIGLDIGAETPAEIAVAIMAEIIGVKNKKKSTYGYSSEVMRGILDSDKYPGRKVLVTIIMRKGSAPQGAGVKMLVFPDGKCIGTIGGGCMESNILQKALFMSRSNSEKVQVCQVDLTGEDAEDDGMVCGGTIDVLLEVVEQNEG